MEKSWKFVGKNVYEPCNMNASLISSALVHMVSIRSCPVLPFQADESEQMPRLVLEARG